MQLWSIVKLAKEKLETQTFPLYKYSPMAKPCGKFQERLRDVFRVHQSDRARKIREELNLDAILDRSALFKRLMAAG
jgi:hypothetical protein